MVNHKLLNILILQGRVADQILHIEERKKRGIKSNVNIGIKYMEPDELINFHWKRIEFLEWLKPLAKKQIQIVLQEMQLKSLQTDLQVAKVALVKNLIVNLNNES